MKSVTVGGLYGFPRCDSYGDDAVRLLTHGLAHDTPVTIADILHSGAPPDAKLWCARRPELMEKEWMFRLAVDFAWRALPVYERARPGIPWPRRAIELTADWLQGKADPEERVQARARVKESTDADISAGLISRYAVAAAEAARFAACPYPVAAIVNTGSCAREALPEACRQAELEWQVEQVERVIRGVVAA